jgi:AraC-like DNA-binding protein
MTSPIKVIDPAVKLNLAIESLLKPQLKAKELAEQFGMSETTAKRAMKDFHDEACKIIDQRVADEEAALQAAEDAKKAAKTSSSKKGGKKTEADAPKVEDAPKTDAPKTDAPPAAPAAPATPKARAPGTDIARGEKGFKPRNGRWTVLNALFAEKGFDDAAALYIEANKRGVAAGLKELNRGSFYSMLSMAKKKSLTAATTAASVKDVSKDDNKAADTSTSNDAGAADTDKS